jgi:hypothetical protein
MPPSTLVDYFTSLRDSGTPYEPAVAEMLATGWGEDEIEAALTEVYGPPPPLPPESLDEFVYEDGYDEVLTASMGASGPLGAFRRYQQMIIPVLAVVVFGVLAWMLVNNSLFAPMQSIVVDAPASRDNKDPSLYGLFPEQSEDGVDEVQQETAVFEEESEIAVGEDVRPQENVVYVDGLSGLMFEYARADERITTESRVEYVAPDVVAYKETVFAVDTERVAQVVVFLMERYTPSEIQTFVADVQSYVSTIESAGDMFAVRSPINSRGSDDQVGQLYLLGDPVTDTRYGTPPFGLGYIYNLFAYYPNIAILVVGDHLVYAGAEDVERVRMITHTMKSNRASDLGITWEELLANDPVSDAELVDNELVDLSDTAVRARYAAVADAFWQAYAAGDQERMGEFYADEVVVLAGSESLSDTWNLPGASDRFTDALVNRADLMDFYAEIQASIGREAWQQLFDDVTDEDRLLRAPSESVYTPNAARDTDAAMEVRYGSNDRLLFYLDQVGEEIKVTMEWVVL